MLEIPEPALASQRAGEAIEAALLAIPFGLQPILERRLPVLRRRDPVERRKPAIAGSLRAFAFGVATGIRVRGEIAIRGSAVSRLRRAVAASGRPITLVRGMSANGVRVVADAARRRGSFLHACTIPGSPYSFAICTRGLRHRIEHPADVILSVGGPAAAACGSTGRSRSGPGRSRTSARGFEVHRSIR